MEDSSNKMKRVPWKSTQEWIDVKNKVISQKQEDILRAHEILLMWKARCINLPAHVDCTLGILQVLVETVHSDCYKRCLFNEEADRQLRYSTALLRFVNHVSASTCLQGDTFYLVAHKQNIPDWVVNLRHDIAHSATLPPLSLLEAALFLGKQWLIENYWEPIEQDMACVDGSSMNITPNYTSGFVPAILKDAINAWWICRSNANKYLSIRELKEGEWHCLLNFLEKITDYKLVRRESEVKKLQSMIKICKKERFRSKGKISLLPNIEKNVLGVLNILYKKENEKLNKCFLDALEEVGFLQSGGSNVQDWEPFLQVLHNVDSLQVILQFLFEKLCGSSVEETSCAENWLSVLAPSLENLRHRWKQFKVSENSETDESLNDLHLSLRQPPCLKLDMLRQCLLHPTPSSAAVIARYFKFLKPTIPKSTRSAINELMKLYTNDLVVEATIDTNGVIEGELFSVEDLKSRYLTEIAQNSSTKHRWQQATEDEEIWRRCSIGILPNQVDPIFELPPMQWTEVHGRKRKATDDLCFVNE